MRPQRLYVFEFEVRGHGNFPLDMLRHDRCHPKSRDDVRSIVNLGSPNGKRTVRLRMTSLSSEDGPTEARWASFDWPVVPIQDQLLGSAS